MLFYEELEENDVTESTMKYVKLRKSKITRTSTTRSDELRIEKIIT